jgi:ATP-dependent protease Clp ATPase subunit
VEHAARLVVATATGVVNRTDIEAYLDDLVTAATLSYRKVFDMGDCRLVLSDDDMRAIGERVRSHERLGPMGKVAIIEIGRAHV